MRVPLYYIAKINLKTKKYVDNTLNFRAICLQYNFKEIQNITYCILQKYSTKKQLIASYNFRRKKTGKLTRKIHSILKYKVCQYF
jgi:predicted MarR family transcription regulator